VPKRGSTGGFELKPMQDRALNVLRTDGAKHLTRARYEEITGVSRSRQRTISPSSSRPGSSLDWAAGAQPATGSRSLLKPFVRKSAGGGGGRTSASVPSSRPSARATTRGHPRPSSRLRAIPTSTWPPAGTEASDSGRVSSASAGPDAPRRLPPHRNGRAGGSSRDCAGSAPRRWSRARCSSRPAARGSTRGTASRL